MKKLTVLSAIILWIGGLNWGLIGVLNFNIIGFIFGDMPILVSIIYILFGLAAIHQIYHCCCCKKCTR